MLFQARNLILLAVILAAFYIAPSRSTVTVTTKFDSYANVLKNVTIMNDRLTFLRAVWGEIRADEPENMERTKTFYDNLLTYTKGAVNVEAEEASELAAEVREVLVVGNGRLLAETLNSIKSQQIVNVKLFRTELLTKYNFELLNAIFEHAIDASYPFKPTDLLHAELNDIDVINTSSNLVFMLRVNWNLYLYHRFLQRGDINDKYVYEAAWALRNLKYSNYYRSLTNDTVRRIDADFNYFPSSLSTLFSSTSICLENGNMKNYFLYFPETASTAVVASMPAIIRNRYDSKDNQRLVWISSFPTTVSPTYLYLKSKNINWFLYKERNNPSVVVQRSDNDASLRNWKPSLYNNTIMFEQNGSYMCATRSFDANLLGFGVQALRSIDLDNANCQWALTDCSEI